MIRPVRAYIDSQGVLHPTREAACKAEFRFLLWNTDWVDGDKLTIPLDVLVENIFAIDKMIGDATREDTSMKGVNNGEG